jgi:hypothetical protein
MLSIPADLPKIAGAIWTDMNRITTSSIGGIAMWPKAAILVRLLLRSSAMKNSATPLQANAIDVLNFIDDASSRMLLRGARLKNHPNVTVSPTMAMHSGTILAAALMTTLHVATANSFNADKVEPTSGF